MNHTGQYGKVETFSELALYSKFESIGTLYMASFSEDN